MSKLMETRERNDWSRVTSMRQTCASLLLSPHKKSPKIVETPSGKTNVSHQTKYTNVETNTTSLKPVCKRLDLWIR